MLKRPVGIAGVIVLVFGVLVGLDYDPKRYEQENPVLITDPVRAARVMVENTKRAQKRDMELVMIWGSIGLGLLMLGSAAWKASRPGTEMEEGSADPQAT